MERGPTGRSLGLVETHGFVAAVEAADAMTKAARVEIVRYEVTRAALVTILVRGELAEVEAAVAAGSAAAAVVGDLRRGHVIASPSPEIESVLLARRSAEPSSYRVRRRSAP
jgi:microcompartment protein CcmL/EutN